MKQGEVFGAVCSRNEPGHEISRSARSCPEQHGFLLTPILATIADTAGGYAGFTLFPADAGVLTVNDEPLAPPTGVCRRRARSFALQTSRSAIDAFVDKCAGSARPLRRRAADADGARRPLRREGLIEVAQDFWASSGSSSQDSGPAGQALNDGSRAFLERELPPAAAGARELESCTHPLAARGRSRPRSLEAVEDADARENWREFPGAFAIKKVDAPSLEEAYRTFSGAEGGFLALAFRRRAG